MLSFPLLLSLALGSLSAFTHGDFVYKIGAQQAGSSLTVTQILLDLPCQERPRRISSAATSAEMALRVRLPALDWGVDARRVDGAGGGSCARGGNNGGRGKDADIGERGGARGSRELKGDLSSAEAREERLRSDIGGGWRSGARACCMRWRRGGPSAAEARFAARNGVSLSVVHKTQIWTAVGRVGFSRVSVHILLETPCLFWNGILRLRFTSDLSGVRRALVIRRRRATVLFPVPFHHLPACTTGLAYAFLTTRRSSCARWDEELNFPFVPAPSRRPSRPLVSLIICTSTPPPRSGNL
ncbi:hypothetical protein C8J57DRAFT_1248428 [Mycena rebaudengoi]|nr:hypothetical protein C8J57DRAFT_1248428 [Mycena rebaudengoi]